MASRGARRPFASSHLSRPILYDFIAQPFFFVTIFHPGPSPCYRCERHRVGVTPSVGLWMDVMANSVLLAAQLASITRKPWPLPPIPPDMRAWSGGRNQGAAAPGQLARRATCASM